MDHTPYFFLSEPPRHAATRSSRHCMSPPTALSASPRRSPRVTMMPGHNTTQHSTTQHNTTHNTHHTTTHTHHSTPARDWRLVSVLVVCALWEMAPYRAFMGRVRLPLLRPPAVAVIHWHRGLRHPERHYHEKRTPAALFIGFCFVLLLFFSKVNLVVPVVLCFGVGVSLPCS